MGVWGAGILDNDTSLEVKSEFERLLNDGKSVADAVTIVAANHRRENYGEYAATWADAILGLAWCATSRTDDLPDEFRTLAIDIIESEVGVNRGWNEPGEAEWRRAEEFDLLTILEGEAEHPDRHIGEKRPDVLIEYLDGNEANDDPANVLRITDDDTLRVHGETVFGADERGTVLISVSLDVEEVERTGNVVILQEITTHAGETIQDSMIMSPSEMIVLRTLIDRYFERGPNGNGRWKGADDASDVKAVVDELAARRDRQAH